MNTWEAICCPAMSSCFMKGGTKFMSLYFHYPCMKSPQTFRYGGQSFGALLADTTPEWTLKFIFLNTWIIFLPVESVT